MNWDAIGAIAEIGGATGVIVTLVYLSGQIRQANRNARAQARQWMVEQANSELHQLMNDPNLSALFDKESVTEEESVKLNFFLAATMRQREWEWFQYRDGIIGRDVYEAYHGVIGIHLGTARTRRWWNGVGKTAFNPDFAGAVDDLLRGAELTTYFGDIKHYDR
jgi:hypothetical protein